MLKTVLAASIAGLWIGGAAAADEAFLAGRAAGETLATDLIGATLYGRSNEELGEVRDLILDPGRSLVGVIVAVGEREIGIPYRLILARAIGGEVRYTLSLDAAAMAGAPDYVREDQSGRQMVPAPCGGQCPGDPMANPMPAN